jgi:tetratricopeptide (TPR) repeat protein
MRRSEALLLICAAATALGPAHAAPARLYGQEVGAHPPSPAPERAEALYRRGDAEGAFALLEAHLGTHPEDYVARCQAARAALSVGLLRPTEPEQNEWYRRGMEHGEAAVRLRPDGIDGLFWLTANQGRLAIQLSPRASASAALEVYRRALRILELDPEHAGAHNVLGKIAFEVMALSTVERFFARTLTSDNAAIDGASWEEAERRQKLAVELDPEMPLFRFDLGRTYLHRERWEMAVSELEKALELPDRHPGDALFKREAREALEAARLRRSP